MCSIDCQPSPLAGRHRVAQPRPMVSSEVSEVSPTTRPQRGVGSALVLILLIVVNFAVGGLGALSTTTAVDGWYADAEKVPWNPPPAVFGPAWTVLYVLMAVAA